MTVIDEKEWLKNVLDKMGTRRDETMQAVIFHNKSIYTITKLNIKNILIFILVIFSAVLFIFRPKNLTGQN